MWGCPISSIALSVISLVTEGTQPALIFYLLCQVSVILANLPLDKGDVIKDYEILINYGKASRYILDYFQINNLKIDDYEGLRSKRNDIIASSDYN